MMKNWREYLNLANKIASFLLFVMGAYHGLWTHDYAHGCWEFILAAYCGNGDCNEIKS